MIRAQVESVISRVLRNQIDFLHAAGDERFRFGHDVALHAAAMRTAHPGNDTKAAWMVATLGDFQIRKMLWREPESWRFKIGNESWARGHVEHWSGCRIFCADKDFGFAEFFRTANGFFLFVRGNVAFFFQFVEARNDFGLWALGFGLAAGN